MPKYLNEDLRESGGDFFGGVCVAGALGLGREQSENMAGVRRVAGGDNE